MKKIRITAFALALAALLSIMPTALAAEAESSTAATTTAAVVDEAAADKALYESFGFNVALPQEPTTEEDFVQALIYAALTKTTELRFAYTTETANIDEIAKIIPSAHKVFFRKYPELSAYIRATRYASGKTSIKIYLEPRQDIELDTLKESFVAAKAVYGTLQAENKICDTMSETERAQVFTTWIAAHMTYKQVDATSTTAYGGFKNGNGVCGAYTGMLNLLLRLDGITCSALYGKAIHSNETHTWTYAKLDGEWLHIDATWCNSYMNQYFAKNDAEFAKTHKW